MKKLVLVLSFPAFCLSATAQAHFNLDAPLPNTTTTDGGMGSPPCGVGTASGVITPAQGGHPLTVKINETVAHTGFYRIALAIHSPSELPLDPVVKDAMNNILPPSGMPKGTSSTAAYSDTPVFPVLGDHLFQHNGTGAQKFQMDIPLPNINCDKCTLQVLEFMAGHGFNGPTQPDTGPGGGYFYRHCADLKITADSSLPIMGAGGVGGSAAGGSSSTVGGGGSAAGGAPSSAGGAGGVVAGGTAGVASSAGGLGASGAPAGGMSAGGGTSVGGGTSAGGATSSAGATVTTDSNQDSGSCSFGKRSASSTPIAALLVGALAVGLRRRRRVAVRGA